MLRVDAYGKAGSTPGTLLGRVFSFEGSAVEGTECEGWIGLEALPNGWD